MAGSLCKVLLADASTSYIRAISPPCCLSTGAQDGGIWSKLLKTWNINYMGIKPHYVAQNSRGDECSKSHLFYGSYFKTYKSSLYEEKRFSNITFCPRDIRIFKYANWSNDDVIRSTKF